MFKEKEKCVREEEQSKTCIEPSESKPEIICCIRSRKVLIDIDGYGLPIHKRSCISGIALEKKILPAKPVYILNRQMTLRGITMPILDVLDTRNTYLWVESFRQKIIEHEWSENEAKVFFKYSLSKDIIENVVGDPVKQTLRDCVRKIYDRVYTQRNVSMLRRKIDSLASGQFLTLEDYKEELALLIRSYSVRELISTESQEKMLQKQFWAGLSSSIKNLLSKKISKECSPDEIIRQVFLFKQKMLLRYNLPENFTGVIYVKEKPRICFPMTAEDSTEESEDLPEESMVSCAKSPRKSRVIPIPSLKERMPLKLPALKRIPRGIIIKNDLQGTLTQIIKLYNHKKRDRIFKKPIIGRPFVVYTGCIDNWIAGILLQENKTISIFKMPLVNEQLQYTETEKCILAIDKSKKVFQKIVGDASIVFMTKQYKSFVYTTENGINFIDCMEVPE